MSTQGRIHWNIWITGSAALAITTIFICLMWLILTHFLVFLEQANPSVSAAIVGGMATVMTAFMVAIFTQRQIKQRELDEAHRERKVAIYHRFLDVLTRSLLQKNPNSHVKPINDKELITFIVTFKTEVVLWGSPKVINALYKFEKKSKENNENPLSIVDDLYRAIREDIGLSNSGLKKNQLVKMYLSNPEEADK